MKFISGYVWDGGREEDSLLLQQAGKGKSRVLFGCVSSSGGWLDDGTVGGYLTGRLRKWFYDRGPELCAGKPSDHFVEGGLRAAIGEIFAELAYYYDIKGGAPAAELTGILALNERFWLIHSGNSRAYLLNQRFWRPHIRLLTAGAGERRAAGEREVNVTEGQTNKLSAYREGSLKEPEIVSGRLQREVGLLVCTPGFYRPLAEEVLRECLNVREIEKEIQIEKRLGELQKEILRGPDRAGGCALLFKAV